jgi:hypothetical protein
MEQKYSNLETKAKENLILSENPLKIGVVHYFWDSSSRGVNTVVRNSIEKGLGSLYSNSKVILIGEHFQTGVFDKLEHRDLPLFTSDSYRYLLGGLVDLTKDLDAVIIENPLRGINPYATKAFKDFTELNGKSIHWRNHDFIWDHPEDWNKFNLVFEHAQQAIPRSNGFSCSVLTLPAKINMQKYYDKEINVLRNSVVCDDYNPNPKKEKELRELLEEKRIISPDEISIPCPNRIVNRKLIEHNFPIVKDIMDITGQKYCLLVTESIDDEKDYPQQNYYQRILEDIANRHNIPCSLGKLGGIIDDINFTVPNLYRIPEPSNKPKFALLPSRLEGFGYGNVDPWMCGLSVIGRYTDVHPDFEKYGMDFKHYWDDEVLNLKKNEIENFKYIEKILSNDDEYASFKTRMKLEWRLEQAEKVKDINKIAIEENFNHLKSAKDLVKIMKLPEYEKLG